MILVDEVHRKMRIRFHPSIHVKGKNQITYRGHLKLENSKYSTLLLHYFLFFQKTNSFATLQSQLITKSSSLQDMVVYMEKQVESINLKTRQGTKNF